MKPKVTSREEIKQLKNVDGVCDAKGKDESMESTLGKPWPWASCWLSQGQIRTTPSSIKALKFAKDNAFRAKSFFFVDETGCARFQGYDSIPSYQGNSVGPQIPIYSFHRTKKKIKNGKTKKADSSAPE